ncbi:uncharacterized protein CTRU02_215809 [Colletotrichum truncatum]|uniref:Uncharacterized protein n=1 Tax=Colletotrichum truncatum TaxID=5467 RepID=A0ACC3YBQ3_COLTU|nr:uncharacterized protein CTRU02_15548 [Colletotrichum truncatum]KAF6780927.1 hypothetical protein CTRU02_15548 [Colletotrichum truncatum]
MPADLDQLAYLYVRKSSSSNPLPEPDPRISVSVTFLYFRRSSEFKPCNRCQRVCRLSLSSRQMRQQ